MAEQGSTPHTEKQEENAQPVEVGICDAGKEQEYSLNV